MVQWWEAFQSFPINTRPEGSSVWNLQHPSGLMLNTCLGGQQASLLTACWSVCLKQVSVVGLSSWSLRLNIQRLSYACEAGLEFWVKSSSPRARVVTEWGAYLSHIISLRPRLSVDLLLHASSQPAKKIQIYLGSPVPGKGTPDLTFPVCVPFSWLKLKEQSCKGYCIFNC